MGEESRIDTARVWYAADDLERNRDWDKLWGDGTYGSWGLTRLKRQLRTLSYTVNNDATTLSKINAAIESIENVQNNFIAPTTDKTQRVAQCCKEIAVRYEQVENNMMLDFTGKRDDLIYTNFTSHVIKGYNDIMNYWGHDVYARVEEVAPEPAASWLREHREDIEQGVREVTEAAIITFVTMGAGSVIEGGGFVVKGSEYAAELGKTALSYGVDKIVENHADERVQNIYSLGKSAKSLAGHKFSVEKADDNISWYKNIKNNGVEGFEIKKLEFKDFEPNTPYKVLDEAKGICKDVDDIIENPIWEDDLWRSSSGGGGGGGGGCRAESKEEVVDGGGCR